MYKTCTGQYYLIIVPALNRNLSEMKKYSSPSGFCHRQVLLLKHFPKKATAHMHKTISNLSPAKTNMPLSFTCKIQFPLRGTTKCTCFQNVPMQRKKERKKERSKTMI
jgi:hypothetical protein